MTDDRSDPDNNDRFGISDEALRLVHEKHRGIIRSGMIVPTRSEVRTAPIGWLAPVLVDWIWDSPTELVPTDAMIEAVIAELEARPDAGTVEVRQLIGELRDP